MFDVLTRKWWVVALRSVLGILFGIIALVYPGATLVSLALVFGAYARLDGVFALFVAANGEGNSQFWYVLEGIAGIAVGIFTFFYPQITAEALVYLIALWAIITGVFEIIAGFQLPIAKDWLLALAGVLSVAFGILVVFYPQSSALAIVSVIGIYAVLFGIVFVVFAIRLRELATQPTLQSA